MGGQLEDEVNMYRRIEAGSKHHVGRSAVRTLVDSFDVDGPDGQYQCLVHAPLFESIWDFPHRNPVRRLPAPVLAFILQRTFHALDYIRTECRIIHTGMLEHKMTPVSSLILSAHFTNLNLQTDISAINLMFAVGDDSVFTEFEQAELNAPSPRK
jgi:hypothetical protein